MRQAIVKALNDGVGWRGLRFLSVSVVTVPIVQLLILLLQVLVGLQGWVANFVAVAALTGPAYVISVRWVWGHGGGVGKGPVVWFWVLSIVGLLASTVAVYASSTRIDGVWVANVANLSTYGVIFAVRFLVLDRLLHRTDPSGSPVLQD